MTILGCGLNTIVIMMPVGYVTAYEHFKEHRSTLKMTTSSANLDSLIDSIQKDNSIYFMEVTRPYLMVWSTYY